MAGKKVETLVSDAVMELIYDHTMIAQVVMGCGGVNVVEDDSIPAMAWTDGKGIFINKKYIKESYEINGRKLGLKEYLFLIAHEALHLMLLTTGRLGNKNRILWNMATDYAINSILVNNRFSNMPEGGLLNPRYDNWSAEQIYDDLSKKFMNKSNTGNNGIGGGSNLNSPQSYGDGSKEGIPEDCDTQKELTGNRITMDAHYPIDSDTEESVNLRVTEIMKSFSHDPSKLFKRIMELRPLPKFPWRKILEKYIKGFIKSTASWKLPSKRGLALGTYLPKILTTPCINIAIAIDTSGSISGGELSLMLTHIKKILHSFKYFNLELFCFSTQVHEETVVKLNKQNIRNFKVEEYKLKSNGGTSISSSFEYINNHKEKFDVFICMTDGCDSIEDLKFNKTAVIWTIVGDNKRAFKSPKGVKRSAIIFMED